MTYEQQVELMKYITDHPLYDYWRPLFTVLLGTGCRIGEICGLRWQDVDLENRVIDINHSMTYFRRGKQAPYAYDGYWTIERKRADSLIEKEFHSLSYIPSTLTVCPIIPFLIPETESGQSPEKGNTIIRNKVRHRKIYSLVFSLSLYNLNVMNVKLTPS